MQDTIRQIIDTDFFRELKKVSNNQVFFVGGCVRDSLILRKYKDADILVRNIPAEQLITLLSKHGTVDLVGESFGVIKFKPEELELEEAIDISLPRQEKSTGIGHKDFVVNADCNISLEDDLKRRDFTINTLVYDSRMNVIDLFGGLNDLKKGIIRTVTQESFTEDPLRMMRAIQFAIRFGFTFDFKTHKELILNSHLIETVSKERIYEEFKKVLKVWNSVSLTKFVQLLNQYNISKHIFNTVFNIDNYRCQSVYEFWFLISECYNKETKAGTELKSKLGVGNDIEKLCNLMQSFHLDPNYKTFLNLYNFDNNALANTFLNYDEFDYIIDEGLPLTVGALDINGNDLIELGYKGKDIGNILNELHRKTVSKEWLKNKKADLIAAIQTNES